MFSKLIVSTPWYFFAASIATGLIVAAWLYIKNRKNQEVSPRILKLFFLLRFLSVSLLCFLLLEIYIRHLHRETEQPLLLLALDNSGSMVAGSDSSAVKTDFLKRLGDFEEQLGKDFSVRSLMFGSEVRPLESPQFNEKETDLDLLLRELENNFSNQNIGALVLISDGIYNKGANPLYASEKLGYPIYTVAMGDTTEIRDLLIQKINYNEVVHAGNQFPVEVIISAKKMKGRTATVTLLQNNQQIGKQTVNLTGDNFSGACTFTLNAENPGINRYSVKVSSEEQERNLSNNSQSFVTEVIKNKEKILLVANAPHPDIAAIRESVLLSGNYEFESVTTEQTMPPLKSFNLVIFHGLTGAGSEIIKTCEQNNIPYWLIAPKWLESLPGARIAASGGRMDDSEPALNKTFGLFSLSPGLTSLIDALPAVHTPFGRYQMSNSASNLLNQKIGNIETEQPIFYFTENAGLKSAVFLGDGLWLWRMRDFAENKDHKLFSELVSKTIQYLVIKGDKSFFRIQAPRLINENTPFEISAEVYNKSYEPTTEPEVSIEIINQKEQKFNYTFSAAARSYFLNAGLLEPGDYRYIAKTKVNNELLVKEGLFSVKEVVAEKLNTVADHTLLSQLAGRSGGKMIRPDSLETLMKLINANKEIRPVIYTQVETSPLIDLKWIMFVLVLLLTVEWFLRKRFLII